MKVSRIQNAFMREDIKSLGEENCSLPQLDRLIARIARRYGRHRSRKPTGDFVFKEEFVAFTQAA